MKKKISVLFAVAALLCLFLCAFEIDKNSSLKDLTHPYINTYVCTEATLGDEDLLEQYEYFTITFLDTEHLEISFKKKGGKKHIYQCPYVYDKKSGEFSAEIGILGFKFRQSAKIKQGKFLISMPILSKQLTMKFAVK